MIGKVSVMSNRLRSFLIVVMSIVVVMAALPMNAFRVNADTFFIYYYGNGGEEANGSSTFSANSDDQGKFTIKNNILPKNVDNPGFINYGYIFSGWKDDEGTAYTIGQEYYPGKNLHINAQWTFDSANYVKVTLKPNGVSGDDVTIVMPKTGGNAAAKSITHNATWVATDKIFDRWTTNENGSGDEYHNEAVTFSSDTTLYAQWADICTIKFNANGGSDSMADQVVGQGVATAIVPNGFTAPANKTFGCWNTAANGSGTAYADTETITLNDSEITLYAQWAEPCTITFGTDIVDGSVSGSMSAQTVGKGCKSILNANLLTRTNYEFVGWKDSSTNQIYQDLSVVTFTSNTFLVAQWRGVDKTVDLTLTPTDGGSVTINGKNSTSENCEYGTGVTIEAISTEGYDFEKWTDNNNSNQVVSTDNPYNFTITGDVSYAANFKLRTYTISATSNNASMGTVTGSGPYTHGSSVTLTATPNSNCHFVEWRENGATVSKNDTYNFTATGNRTIEAVFSDTYEISVTVMPSGCPATITNAGTHTQGTSITLTANEVEGYTFNQWNYAGGTVAGTNKDLTVTVSSDATYIAEYSINVYQIGYYVETDGTGTVNGKTSDTISREYGTEVTLTAVPATGYHFVHWIENGFPVANASASYTFTASKDRILRAVFEINTYSVNVTADPDTHGSVECTPGVGTYNYGSTVSFKAIPGEGYHFVKWTNNGNDITNGTNAEITVSVTEVYDLVAHFKINEYDINTYVNDSNFGSVSGNDVNTYTHGSTVNLTAMPATGYHFVNWTEGVSEVTKDNPYVFAATSARDLTANFAINNYLIDVSSGGNGTVTGKGNYDHFENITVTATADTGYHFVNWTDENGTVVSTDASYNFDVDSARVLVANFVINSYAIGTTAGDHGSVEGSGTYNHFSSITVKAIPDTGYHFVNWTENGNVVSTSPSYTFTVTGARDLTANFAINYYTVKYVNDDGTVLQETQVAYGNNAYYQQQTTPTKKPTAQFTYTFAGWDNKVTLVTDDVTYTATYDYTINKYKITFANEDGSVLQTSELEYGKMPVYEKETPTKASTVQETFTFAGWDKEISKVTGETVYTATYTAKAITKDDVNYKHFTVTFETNGGSEVVAQLVAEGGVAFKPEEPMRERYTFGGWYIDAALTKPFSFATVITSDITLYAKWIKGSQDVDATYAIVGSGSMSWSTGSGEDITVAVERSKDNDSIATHFKGVQIDGVELEYYNYELTDDNSGVIIRADALEGLAVGSHTITILYDDGKAEVELVIADANKPAETVEETTATEAGGGEIVNITTEKSSYLGLWIALAIVAGVVIAAFPIFIIKRRSLK